MKPIPGVRAPSWPLAAALAFGLAGLAGGCGGSQKSDGQIAPAAEAQSAAEAISKQYAQDYGAQYAKKKGRR